MRRSILILTVFLLLSCGNNPRDEQVTSAKNGLRDSLVMVMEADQYYRDLISRLEEDYPPDSDTLQKVYTRSHIQDSLNLAYITSLLENRGWPSRKTVGDTAVLAPFFVLQHSGDPEVMNRFFPLVKAMVENGDISPRSLAYYTDRLAMLRKEPQVFGTQVFFNSETERMELYPVRNIDSLDIRRTAAELGPIDDYLNSMGAVMFEGEHPSP